MRFKIVVPSFNSVDFLPKTLASIEEQEFEDFDVCVIDDGSTLPKQREIIADFAGRNNWKTVYHEKNEGALKGLLDGIPLLNCHDEDVIVVVDGDDWLAHPNVLQKLAQVYAQNDVWLTWGQCEIYPTGKTPMYYAQPIPDMVIEQQLYRDIPWVFWHPGTFKYLLWRQIRDEDLRDANGEYFRVMKDKATLFPMLEMAGKRVKFIDETLYIYNISNPLNDYANAGENEMKRVDALLQSRTPYAVL